MTDPITQSMIQGAAGAAGGGGEYIDNIFSTYIYSGTGSNRTINNGIDLLGEGGLVWTKSRNSQYEHGFIDTLRGSSKVVRSPDQGGQLTDATIVTSFNNNGFSLGSDQNYGLANYTVGSGVDYSSWSFRKQPGFFDVVTYNGNSNTLDSGESQSIAHSLGSTPGLILVKKTSGSQPWAVYHRSLGNTKSLFLNSGEGAETLQRYWNNTSPTSTHFTVGSSAHVNRTGQSYVAYIFAHNDQQFGVGGNNEVIKCDQYTGNGSTNGPVINLGWEPQWVLIKRSSGIEDWILLDCMRGLATDMNDPDLRPNTNAAEAQAARNWMDVSATGFQLKSNPAHSNANGDTYVYMAIRRPDGYVGKPAEAGTDVFAIDAPNSNSVGPIMESGFPVDFAFLKHVVAGTGDWYLSARLMDGQYVKTNDSSQASTYGNFPFDYQNGWVSHSSYQVYTSWMWKRHAGFDVVAYKGSGSADYVYHSLGKIPEMIWVKKRSGSGDWRVYHKGLGTSNDPFDYSIKLNYYAAQIDDATVWNDAAPEINRFTVGTHTDVNASGSNYIAMLFRSVTGISKVGSYTGSTYNVTVSDVGFSPRFLFVKNITTGGSTAVSQWNMVDTVRGFTSGNDSRLWLNSGSGPNNYNYAYPTSSGFVVTEADWKENGATYIYYAHA
jgi:hypothetical protein